MASVEDILLPDIGDFSGVEVIEILVAPGDRIEPEQSLLTLESDKATMEIPAPKGGVVEEVKVKVGDKISQGTILLTLRGRSGPATATAPDAPSPETAPTAPAGAATSPTPSAKPARPAAASGGEIVSVVLPDIGEYSDVPVLEVLVGVGDRVEVDQSLLTLESDKATMEIPSPQAGVVEQIVVQVGDTLSQGDLLLTLRADEVAAAAEEIPESAAEESAAPMAPSVAAKPGAASGVAQRPPGEAERRQAPVTTRPQDVALIAGGGKAHASPAVRRFARELGVNLALVNGSGPKNRVLKEDVQAFVKQTLARGGAEPSGALPFALPAAPEIDFAKFGAIEVGDLPRIKRISGRHLHRSWLSVPHVTQFDEADITELEDFRRARNKDAAPQDIRLTFLPFLLKAVAATLSQMPIVKASLTPDGERLVHKHYTHVGVAVDTPNGLLVPVLRNVDRKGIQALAAELAEISVKARDGKLLPGDMQGGCFTISSLGGIGGTAFTPIINAPEVAILGVSRSQMRPVWDGKEFAPRLMLPLSLSYDHRVIDGADGARFTTLLASLLGDIRRLLL